MKCYLETAKKKKTTNQVVFGSSAGTQPQRCSQFSPAKGTCFCTRKGEAFLLKPSQEFQTSILNPTGVEASPNNLASKNSTHIEAQKCRHHHISVKAVEVIQGYCAKKLVYKTQMRKLHVT